MVDQLTYYLFAFLYLSYLFEEHPTGIRSRCLIRYGVLSLIHIRCSWFGSVEYPSGTIVSLSSATQVYSRYNAFQHHTNEIKPACPVRVNLRWAWCSGSKVCRCVLKHLHGSINGVIILPNPLTLTKRVTKMVGN